jgi:hypothetical protein
LSTTVLPQRKAYVVHIFRESREILVMETSPGRIMRGKALFLPFREDIEGRF